MPAVNLRSRASPVGPYSRSNQQLNGFYVHSSPPKGHYRLMADIDDLSDIYVHTFPPRVVQMNPSMIRQWLRGGDIEQLEQVVLEGQGHKLIGEYSPDPRVRNFLKSIPNYIAKISELYSAVNKGDLDRLKSVTTSGEPTMRNIFLCKDQSGVGLLHRAVHNDSMDIVQWLIEKHPETVKLKDRDGKTALHYCGASTDREEMWRVLVKAGADPNVIDSRGRTAAFYMEKPGAIELPNVKLPSGSFKRFTSGREGLVVKPSNIRIWIHDRDIGRLQQVLWEGYGNKLRTETSNNPRVKRFLDGIPYAMNLIKDVHGAVVNDDYEEFVKKTSDPVPVQILGSKDANGLNPLHKAAGLGRQSMVESILEKSPKLVYATDQEGRTPLHYAAWLKSNDYIHTLLVENGADEMAFDNNGRLPSYYKANPKEPLARLLSVIPDAPRTSVTFPPNWDWGLLQPSARSNLNIPQLVNKGLEPDRKSASDYGIHLRPPEVVQPDFLTEPAVTRMVQEVREKIVKVEQKIFEDEDATKKPEEGKPEEEKPAENEMEEPEESPPGAEEDEPEVAGEAEVNEPETEMVEEPSAPPDVDYRVSPEAENETEPPVVERNEPNGTESPRNGEQVEGKDSGESETAETNENPRAEEEEGTREGGNIPTELTNGESYDEKTEREIAEERQRLMDEGLIKVESEEDVGDDREIVEIIQNGDMQGLATLVLEGEGERLLGKRSDNSEIQGFLDNVPSYIAKIKAVHKAARSGELRDLQAALDRRRFAVAKDGTNTMGVTPLHVAVLFGRTPIIKYLGGRFPETLNAKDKKGRTPLHYAASLADNNHYFNILLNLGADRRMRDDAGNVPGYYLENPGSLTQEMLLQEFNAPAQIAKEMLSDREFPLFGTDEGKYLANALGEPLIRGLTEIANKRPSDPITYLANFLYDFINKNKGVSSPVRDPSIHARETVPEANEGVPVSRQREAEASQDAGGDSDDLPQTAFSPANRDEYGQTVVHFAAARAHGRSGLFQLIQESGINIGYRDELYRTARDVALQANIPENINEIDKFVLGLAARGETDKLTELLLEGYDHILDLEDDEDSSIIDIVAKKNETATLEFLKSIPSFEERRERIHRAIRAGDPKLVEEIVAESSESGKKLLIGKSTTSRCSLHIAVLCQQEAVTELIAQKYPETLRVGDNLERTALHYAMGVDKVETLSKILIQCGARRVTKDLKGRQPTYYFMNKSDILRLQEEEELLRM